MCTQNGVIDFRFCLYENNEAADVYVQALFKKPPIFSSAESILALTATHKLVKDEEKEKKV